MSDAESVSIGQDIGTVAATGSVSVNPNPVNHMDPYGLPLQHPLLSDHVHYNTVGQLQLGADFAVSIQEAAALPLPNLFISGTDDNPAAVELSFNMRYGKTYRLEYSTNLVDGIWDRLIPDLVGANKELSITNTPSLESFFYRVITE